MERPGPVARGPSRDLLAVAALLVAVFVPMAVLRIVDADEGTILLVSKLAARGQVPYRDFFYPQMCLLLYVYGAWMKLFGYSWYGARVLSALLAVALGLLIHRHVSKARGRAWGALAALLFASSSLAFGWYPLIKTYVLPTVLLFGALVVAGSRWRWRWAACGLLVGLATDCRVYVIVAAPAFLLEIWFTDDQAARASRLAHLAGGLLLALLPNALFLAIDAGTFSFDIVRNQVIRTDYGFLGWVAQKRVAAAEMLAIDKSEGVVSLQFLILFVLNLAASVSSAVARRRPSLAAMIALTLTLVSLVPTPVYTQYFCMPLPFLLVIAVAFLAELTDGAGRAARALVAALAAVYVLVAPVDLHRYTTSGALIPGVRSRADVANWKLPAIQSITRAIDRELRPGRGFVMTFWPGYLVESEGTVLPGMENHFALMFSDRVTPAQAERYRLMSWPALERHFREGTADVIVLGNWTQWTNNEQPLRERVQRHGYVLKERIGDADVFARP